MELIYLEIICADQRKLYFLQISITHRISREKKAQIFQKFNF